MTTLPPSAVLAHARAQVEAAVRQALPSDRKGELYRMLAYHLGLGPAPDGTPPGSGGKRVRGVLCLLAGEAVGGEAARVAPAAAAVELLHSFTLLHDDIADRDETRRGRPTVWRIWGEGQAITAGDAMYALANLALGKVVEQGAPAEVVVRALQALNAATLAICEGQQLDLAYEGRDDVRLPDYRQMIGKKTALLFATAAGLGVELGGGTEKQSAALWGFGLSLGLAFQVQDDILGLWGEAEELGKPVGSDLRRNKRSLPILYALERDHPLRERLAAALASGVGEAEAAELAREMEAAGVRAFCEEQVAGSLKQALLELEGVPLQAGPAAALRHLAESLVGRRR